MGVQALALEFNLCQILCGFSEELFNTQSRTPLHKLFVIMVVDFMGKILDPLQLFIVMYSVFSAELSLYFSLFYAQCKCQDTFKLHINLRATTLRIIFFPFFYVLSVVSATLEITFSLNLTWQCQLMISVSDDGSCKAGGNGS